MTFPVVCIIGSMKFYSHMLWVAAKETEAGHIVLMPFSTISIPKVKTMLDEMHRQKIDMASEVILVTQGGYIGESTQKEIEYAQSKGIPVRNLP